MFKYFAIILLKIFFRILFGDFFTKKIHDNLNQCLGVFCGVIFLIPHWGIDFY